MTSTRFSCSSSSRCTSSGNPIAASSSGAVAGGAGAGRAPQQRTSSRCRHTPALQQQQQQQQQQQWQRSPPQQQAQQQQQRRRQRRRRGALPPPLQALLAAPSLLLALLLTLLLLLQQPLPASAIKLKFSAEECLSYDFNQYEYFYGSYVAMLDAHGLTAKYDLSIIAPSGQSLYDVTKESEATFHLVPVESGTHRFCLRFNPEASPSRAAILRDVTWNIHVGYSEGHDRVEETDTQYLWHHVYQIDGQVQELKSTLNYLYWRERRHRQTVESTHRRTLLYALLRCVVLVGASVGQVLYIRRMFSR